MNSDWADQKAAKILGQSDVPLVAWLARDIATALRDAARVPEGCVRTRLLLHPRGSRSRPHPAHTRTRGGGVMSKGDTMKDIKEAVGKTIATVERIPAEYGRTYRSYTLLTFTDGTKVMQADGDTPWEPCPDIENMRKAPAYFTAEDIANKMLRIEQAKRRREAERKEQARRDIERLKREIGE